MGHTFSPNGPITYTDGEIVGYCAGCGDRLRIPWFPGGTAAARARSVAGLILTTPGRPRIAQIEQLRKALEHLKEDRRVIDEAQSYVELAMERL